jgi:hypothetical protein
MKMESKKVLSKEKEAAIEAIRESVRRWPSHIVPRTQVPTLTGNLYSVGYMANCDSLKIGVPGAFRIGRKIVYEKNLLADWLIKRMEV